MCHQPTLYPIYIKHSLLIVIQITHSNYQNEHTLSFLSSKIHKSDYYNMSVGRLTHHGSGIWIRQIVEKKNH